MTFFISGIFHEVLFNFPFWLSFRKCYFGTMMLYFLIQGLALMFEKSYMTNSHWLLQRAFLWAVVLLPSPLFINDPILLFLGVNRG